MKKVLVSITALLAVALSTWGIAQAAQNNPTNKPTADDVQLQVVHGTTGGMPVTAQVFYATVNSDGTLEKAFPTLATSLRLGIGTYDVRFTNRNQAGCAAGITYGSGTSFGVAGGSGTAVQRAGSSATGWFIETRDPAGALADREFMLQVTC